ncbi:hypothetical protein Tcan_08124 [Toxocara canis]|uniref:Uncharacterized protein n=1 Tax=Toxocara canis TaxID=6265 RepID=A0A0B2VW59_TOXCA|nr:hypothetical protein Tcan_08124 [Toxocara canis]
MTLFMSGITFFAVLCILLEVGVHSSVWPVRGYDYRNGWMNSPSNGWDGSLGKGWGNRAQKDWDNTGENDESRWIAKIFQDAPGNNWNRPVEPTSWRNPSGRTWRSSTMNNFHTPSLGSWFGAPKNGWDSAYENNWDRLSASERRRLQGPEPEWNMPPRNGWSSRTTVFPRSFHGSDDWRRDNVWQQTDGYPNIFASWLKQA